jgi:hypothetical protein
VIDLRHLLFWAIGPGWEIGPIRLIAERALSLFRSLYIE